ncbi:hypothetical protein D3C85_580970 [compost metagenome]
MILFLVSILFIGLGTVSAQDADTKKNIEILKKNLAESKVALKKYEWIETTTSFVNGEQKGVTQKQCYYAVDGKLTKVETGGSTQAKKTWWIAWKNSGKQKGRNV